MSDPYSITAILMLGLVFKFVGFAVRDELWLRTLVMSGLACDAIFYGFRPEPVLQSVLTNSLLILVNVVLLFMILVERTTWRMSDADKDLYDHFPTMVPGQFRRLRKFMTIETLGPKSQLLEEGQVVTDLLLILTDRVLIEKDGEAFPIAGPTFAGEIALLTGERASAGVVLVDGGKVLRIPLQQLRRHMARSPALSNAVVALSGRELARKLANSSPMDRALQR